MHANFMPSVLSPLVGGKLCKPDYLECAAFLWEGNLVSPIYLECRDIFSVDLTVGFLKIRVICVIHNSEYFDKNIIA